MDEEINQIHSDNKEEVKGGEKKKKCYITPE
jgi:hypothetical protein